MNKDSVRSHKFHNKIQTKVFNINLRNYDEEIKIINLRKENVQNYAKEKDKLTENGRKRSAEGLGQRKGLND